MTLEVINGKTSGWLGENTIYIGRSCYGMQGSILANPYKIGRDGDRTQVMAKYRRWLWKQVTERGPVYHELLRMARRSRTEHLKLACWCKPEPCHGDIIKNCIEWLITQN